MLKVDVAEEEEGREVGVDRRGEGMVAVVAILEELSTGASKVLEERLARGFFAVYMLAICVIGLEGGDERRP